MTPEGIIRPGPDEDPLLALVRRLEQLGCHRGGKSKWQCPGHDDHEPSLSINRTSDGRGLRCHCFAGCTQEHVRGVLGWEWSDFYLPEYRLFGQETYSPASGQETLTVYKKLRDGRSSTCTSSCPKLPDLSELERRVEAGDLEPVGLPGGMPESVGTLALRVAADFRRVRALYMSGGYWQPIPYSVRFGAERLGVSKSEVCDALRELREDGWLFCVAELAKRRDGDRKRPRGAYVYVLAAELTDLVVEAPDQEPVAEDHDEAKVLAAVGEPLRGSGVTDDLVAVGDAAGPDPVRAVRGVGGPSEGSHEPESITDGGWSGIVPDRNAPRGSPARLTWLRRRGEELNCRGTLLGIYLGDQTGEEVNRGTREAERDEAAGRDPVTVRRLEDKGG